MSDSDSVFHSKTHQPADADNQNNSDDLTREKYRSQMNQDDQKAKFEKDFEKDLAQSEAAQVASEDKFARNNSQGEIIHNNSSQSDYNQNYNDSSFINGDFEQVDPEQNNSKQNINQSNFDQNQFNNNSYSNDSNQTYPNQNNNSEQPNNNNLQKNKKSHIWQWIIGSLAALIIALGIFSYHEFNELKNTARTQDTMLDTTIKNEGKKIAEKDAPKNIRPQIIKIIETVPLSQIQQAANNEQEFDKLAQQVNFNQQEIDNMQSVWFANNNQNLRQSIQNGNAIQSLAGLRQFYNNNSK